MRLFPDFQRPLQQRLDAGEVLPPPVDMGQIVEDDGEGRIVPGQQLFLNLQDPQESRLLRV